MGLCGSDRASHCGGDYLESSDIAWNGRLFRRKKRLYQYAVA
jgi:hypothetical protein